VDKHLQRTSTLLSLIAMTSTEFGVAIGAPEFRLIPSRQVRKSYDRQISNFIATDKG
jgi:hypothetical protein